MMSEGIRSLAVALAAFLLAAGTARAQQVFMYPLPIDGLKVEDGSVGDRVIVGEFKNDDGNKEAYRWDADLG